MRLLDRFPILLVDDELQDDTAAGRATRALVDHLRADGTQVITAADRTDAEQIVASTATLSCILLDWDVHHVAAGNGGTMLLSATARGRAEALVQMIRTRNPTVPIFLLADRTTAEMVPSDVLRLVTGYVWKLEDTPDFVAARVEEARHEYLEPLLPPFFEALVSFVQEARYSWHTPGHSGGTAFLKSPVGAAFHAFFGENTLRSDLSVSVGELGSLLEHTGPVGAAEAEAAQTFGADRTMFVTNGTSTANKIVFHACVKPGDVVVVDRNCHKSIMHAIVMTGAIPVYLHPQRNAHGIIGPIAPDEMTEHAVRTAIAKHPLVPAGTTEAALAVVTNSTYDGLCYDADAVLGGLAGASARILFDEAWFGYAHFHPLYAGRHAMGATHREGGPPTFSTQSTHKLLTAFSQGSMVHLHDPDGAVSEPALKEAFMMHTSTSPQYGIIASLDVATRMMQGPQGTALVQDAVDEAIAFRRELTALAADTSPDDWCLRVWQPEGVCDEVSEAGDPREPWLLEPGEDWHGYGRLHGGHAMLDPIKVTILTPGVEPLTGLATHGIPAAVVTHFLNERGIVVEKTGAYSFLVLFSLGITKGKSGTLLAELLEFKRLYDAGARLTEAMPRLVSYDPARYGAMTLRELSDELHAQLRKMQITQLNEAMYSEIPEPVVTPAVAYARLVAGRVDMVAADRLAGRISAAMIVPYPPGIPVVMPGERFGDKDSGLVRYLVAAQEFDARFPGFETEIHGIEIDDDGTYRLPCLAV
ncbi:MAG TPA: Orn/Lys/Arg decarboxylase N-terminal domain-containing protein [Solirubrobacteraceae bacterium]|nr:Orn/Lys/Arg decarboxylase N-terminal domain-containing protein [Solirubrobacteraceae bacterium]